jgi:hypothetical protein
MKETIIVMRKMIGIIKDGSSILIALIQFFNGLLDIPEIHNNPELLEQIHKSILETQSFLAVRQVVVEEAQKVIDEHADDILIIE